MAWGWVQSAGGANGNAGTSTLTVTFATANVTSGNKIIAAISYTTITRTITSVQDAALNSLTQVGFLSSSANSIVTALYAMDVPAGDVGTKPAIKLTLSAGSESSMVIQEISGLATGTPWPQ